MSFCRSVLVVLVLLVVGLFGWLASRAPAACYTPWHGTPQWENLLAVYNESLRRFFDSCESRLIETTFGTTQSFACGQADNRPAVLLFHGAGSNALIYGDWIVPKLVANQYYCVAVDFPCDTGKSVPPQGDPANCPQTEEELADWVKQLILQTTTTTTTTINKKVSLAGYSYGAFVAANAAMHHPDMVDKLVLMAPAAILAPVEMGWVWRAILYGVTRTEWTHKQLLDYMAVQPAFYERSAPHHRDQMEAIREVGATVLAVTPSVLEDEALQQLTSRHPTMLLIGEQETVTNATRAAERATQAGFHTVQVYPRGGHLMLAEEPRQQIEQDIFTFLNQ